MAIPYIPGKTVEVPDIPIKDEVHLKANHTAVVVIDMQNDFVRPEGSLFVPAAPDTVPRIQRLLQRARERGVPIAYTQDTHRPHDLEWDTFPAHAEVGSWGREIIDELKPKPEDLICPKDRYDGFYGTWMDHYLGHAWRIKGVVIVGTVSNICVLHTAASAGLRWFAITMPADGISALTEFDQAMTLRQVSWLYPGTVVRTTDGILFED